VQIDVWSDLVCPWCYLGKRRLETALAVFEQRLPERLSGVPQGGSIEVVHRSFQLDPSIPKGQTVRTRDMLMRKYRMTESQVIASQARLEELAAVEGLEYHLAEAHTGNTMDAHRLVHLGREQGIQDAVIERLFRAHFTENRSLFDRASLTTLGSEAGLQGVEELLDSHRYEDAVVAEHRQANDLGANGVPFFVLGGRYGISGAQSVEVFADALTRAWTDL
jgi:predicted DsbA family dithiol-disulfide isomerase